MPARSFTSRAAFMKLVNVTAASVALCLSPAFACDAPGTPNPVSLYSIGNNTLQLKVTNTATEGSEHIIWFLAEDPSGHVVRFTQGRILDGDFAVFNLAKLQSNAQYCFSVWTRVDSTTGCRSQQPSGKVCAWTSDPAQPALNEAHGVTQGQSDTPEPVQVASSGSGNSGGDGGSGGNTGSNGSGGPTLTTVNGVQCCNDPEGSFNSQCCPKGNLICAPPQHWYCE